MSENEVSENGLAYVDLHSHLLPGVDDGCATLEESVAVARRAVELGCRAMVCTPHVGTDRYAANTPEEIERAVERLRDYLREAGVRLEILASGEFRLSERSIEWFETHGVPTLGRSNVVLIDTWAQAWEQEYDDAIEWLFEQGYQPLLAHPERMLIATEQWSGLIERLEQRGVWLQGNFKSFAQIDAARVQERAWQLLSANRYTVLASDTHAFQSIAPRAEGLATIRQRLDSPNVERLVLTGPDRILRGEALDA